MYTLDSIKHAQRSFEELVWKHETLGHFFDASELALFLALERFCSEAIIEPKARWQYCRQTARELMRWKEAFEDYLEQAWVDVSEEYNEVEEEWESNTIPHYALSSGGYLIDTALQEIITLPYGASELLLNAQAAANQAGLSLKQVVALYNGAFPINAHRDPRKARSTKERKRIEADGYLEKAWKEYKFLRQKQAEEYQRCNVA